jgi:hypothetical protein
MITVSQAIMYHHNIILTKKLILDCDITYNDLLLLIYKYIYIYLLI